MDSNCQPPRVPDQMTSNEFRTFIAERDAKPKSKFRNKPAIVDNIRFASQWEAEYYGQLKLRKRAKDIKDFRRQVRFRLVVNGCHICDYLADFVIYHNDDSRTVVDTKSEATEGLPVFQLKKKLLKALHGVDILIAKK
jgi:hypothetical protein